MSTRPNYDFSIYPSLLDCYTRYLSSDELYCRYYGNSTVPPLSAEQFEEKLRQDLLDRINRVPYESVAADRGTAFNEVCDSIVEDRQPKDMAVERRTDPKSGMRWLFVTYKGNSFYFPTEVCRTVGRDIVGGGICQCFTEGTIETENGTVRLYGFPDYVLPFGVHDLKLAGRYEFGDYRTGAQRLVYPYCLRQSGNNVDYFEYDVVDARSWEISREWYAVCEEDEQMLRRMVTDFTTWLRDNRKYITERKVFGE